MGRLNGIFFYLGWCCFFVYISCFGSIYVYIFTETCIVISEMFIKVNLRKN